MRETIGFIILAVAMSVFGALIVYFRRKTSHERWLRRGHADYSKARRRGFFG